MILTICTVLPRAYVLLPDDTIAESSSEYSSEELDSLVGNVSDVSAVSVCAGPGSYTGIRIGLSYAQGLSVSKNIPMYSSSLFEVARRAFDFKGDVLCYANKAELFMDGQPIRTLSEEHSLDPYDLVFRGDRDCQVSLRDRDNLLSFLRVLRDSKGSLEATYVKPFRAG